jgi:hypothetical protein
MRFFRSLPLALNASLLILDHGGRGSLVQAQPIFTSPAHVPVPTEAAIGALTSLAGGRRRETWRANSAQPFSETRGLPGSS